MERAVRGPHAGRVADAHEVIHLRHVALELGDLAGLQRRHRDADGDGLEADAHHRDGLHVRGRQPGDPHPAVRLGHHQALALEHPERLAQRRAADLEVAREGDLRGGLAGRDLAAEDGVAEPVVHEEDVLPVPRARALRHRSSLSVH